MFTVVNRADLWTLMSALLTSLDRNLTSLVPERQEKRSEMMIDLLQVKQVKAELSLLSHPRQRVVYSFRCQFHRCGRLGWYSVCI